MDPSRGVVDPPAQPLRDHLNRAARAALNTTGELSIAVVHVACVSVKRVGKLLSPYGAALLRRMEPIVQAAGLRYAETVRPWLWRARLRMALPPRQAAALRRIVERLKRPQTLPLTAGAAIVVVCLITLIATAPKDNALSQGAQLAALTTAPIAHKGTDADGADLSKDDTFVLPEVHIPDVLRTVTYTVHTGDTLSEIAQAYGISDETLVSYNDVSDARLLQPGFKLHIPNMDGILYSVRPGDTLQSIADEHGLALARIVAVNRLPVTAVVPNQKIFLPGAHMNSYSYRKALGTLFIYPVQGWLTSPYGMRQDPFTGAMDFHNGIDIANALGTPVDAAMDGRVISVGEDRTYGKYVLLDHGGGYESLYGHLSRRFVEVGAYVRTGQEIAQMGDTGYSTGPHLHFSIFKDGVPVNPIVYLGRR